MNYHDIKTEDIMNGEGMRTTLFVSGCIHACEGCYNKSTWGLDSGIPFTDDTLSYLLDTLSPDYISGLSISGGDPLHPENVDSILEICKIVKQQYPTKDIWMWTGYRIEDLNEAQRSVLDYIDTLIDGRYVKRKPTKKPFRGSDNQRRFSVNDKISIALVD